MILGVDPRKHVWVMIWSYSLLLNYLIRIGGKSGYKGGDSELKEEA